MVSNHGLVRSLFQSFTGTFSKSGPQRYRSFTGCMALRCKVDERKEPLNVTKPYAAADKKAKVTMRGMCRC